MSPRHQQQPAGERHSVPAGTKLPRQRDGSHEPPLRTAPAQADDDRTETGGSALVASTYPQKIGRVEPLDDVRLMPHPRLVLAALRASPRARGIASDVFAVVLAVLDVWLVIPEDAPAYSI